MQKNENHLIYGLKSKISINENRNFYNKGLPKNNLYPDIKKDNFDVLGIQFEDIGNDIRESSNMNAILEEVNFKRAKENAFTDYEKMYLQRRNDIYFVFKFIAPYVSKFGQVKANHGIAMFIISKKAFIDMKQFRRSLEKRENIFKIKNFFEDFTNSQIYQNLLKQVESDIEIIQVQAICYSSDIEICSNQIKAEFDMEKIASKNFLELVKETVDEYWFLLAEAMASVKGKNKEDLIKVLQALYYYKSSSKTEV